MNANTDKDPNSAGAASSSDPQGGRDPRAATQAAIKARKILLADSAIPVGKELKSLVAELKGRLEFGLARKVLAKASEGAWDKNLSVWVVQQLALCTYKDEELLPSQRFSEALALLERVGLCSADTVDPEKIDPSTLPESLGLGGGVFKRKWEYDGQIENLQQALVFYLAAWQRDPQSDMGYGGVNAAFVLDVLASRARIIAIRSGTDEHDSEKLALQARDLRLEMARQLPEFAMEKVRSGSYPSIDREYWYLVTMGEIHFGLRNYAEAGEWLAKARLAPAKEWEQETTWERQTTFRQLVTLARIQGLDLLGKNDGTAAIHGAKAALRELLGDETDAALSCFRGRVGLALSGGGFRASLFHLGVLARLAEADVLRSVEVLSTVSGGSIVGAHYYLEIRNLLKIRNDKAIEQADYILVVKQVIENFLKGIQLNLRMRALSNLAANIKMIFVNSYSRSHRMGELYESKLYNLVSDGHPPGEPRIMDNLRIQPDGYQSTSDFKPKFQNWKRRAKVPVLLLNSTALNSGHSWQFTASSMGEPPGLVGQEVDVNERYRRLWYDQAPTPELKKYPLGYAVSASACVPGLFEPLVVKGLYPGRTVRLVDGGVHDNQGVGALLNEGCNLLFCSDASGQMADTRRPADSMIGVSLRSNSILQSRVREAEYQDLRGRLDSHALQGLFFIHLKKGLEAVPLDWIECDDPTVIPKSTSATTEYGVDKDLQRKLASVRTDLDSFTEVEALALMLDGYLMTEHQLKVLNEAHQKNKEPGTWGSFDVEAPRNAWPFLALEQFVRQTPDSSDIRREDLGRQIEVGSSQAFKIWRLSPILSGFAACLGAAVLVALGWLLSSHWNSTLNLGLSVSFPKTLATTLLALAALAVPALKWLQPRNAMRGYAARAALALIGFVLCNLHLWTFDRMYLNRGKLNRLLHLQ